MAKDIKTNTVDSTLKSPESQDNTAVPATIPVDLPKDPNDEFPVDVEVFCQINKFNAFQKAVFIKIMRIEHGFERFYLKEWQKFHSDFHKKVV